MLNERFNGDYKRKAAGIYEYTGDFYTLPFDEAQKKKCMRVNWAAGLVLLAVLLLTGTANQDSSRTLWIVLPYFCCFLPAAYIFYGNYIFMNVPLKMRHSEYENSLMRIKTSCIGLILLAVLNIALEIGYVLTHLPVERIQGECMYLGGYLLLIGIGVWYGKKYDRMYKGIVIEKIQK